MTTKKRDEDAQPPPDGRTWRSVYRGQRFSAGAPELWRAVRRVCREEFAAFAGKPWQTLFEEQVEVQATRKANEKEARKVYAALRSAMRGASEFVKHHSAAGQAAYFLMWWVPEFIDPLLKHNSMSETFDWRKHAPLHDRRAAIAQSWDTYNHLDFPRRRDNLPRMLDNREFAIVSLLCGNKPDLGRQKQVTVAEILDAERQVMALHVKTHGQHWNGDDHKPMKIPRGPEKAKPRRIRKR